MHLRVHEMRPRQNVCQFADDSFECIFLNETIWLSMKIPVMFVPMDSINNIPGLVQILAWRRPGDKPLSEPMMFRLSTHICVTQPQWVKVYSDAYLSTVFSHRANNMGFWWLLHCQLNLAIEQTLKLPVILDAMTLMCCHCNDYDIGLAP